MEPEIAFAPPHPPLAVQLVAFVEDQESVEESPCEIVEGLADNDTVGAGGGVGAGVGVGVGDGCG